MASIANDKAMLDELINGSKDMHALTAKMVFKDVIPQDMPTKEIKKRFHELRQEAKGYEFCFNYAGNASTLVRNYGISKKFHTDFNADELLDENGMSVTKLSNEIINYINKIGD